MKLGKLAPKLQKNAPSLHRLMRGALPVAPDKVDWTTKLTGEPMLLNQKYGCCTISGIGHAQRVWTSQVWGEELDIPDQLIHDTYFGMTGGDDNGLYETDVLSMWYSKGINQPDHQYEDIISGFCTIDHNNVNSIKLGVAWFGVVYPGWALPNGIQGKGEWTIPAGADMNSEEWRVGGWGGHCAVIVKYNADGCWVISWGKLYFVSWDFVAKYMDEAHGPISRTWLDTKGVAPNGFDLAHLQACMSLIAE